MCSAMRNGQNLEMGLKLVSHSRTKLIWHFIFPPQRHEMTKEGKGDYMT